MSPSRSNDGNLETSLKKSVLDLRQALPEPLVRFLPIVLDKVILLLVRPPVVSGHVGKQFAKDHCYFQESIYLQKSGY